MTINKIIREEIEKGIKAIELDIEDLRENFNEEKRDQVLTEIDRLSQISQLNETEKCNINNNKFLLLAAWAQMADRKKIIRETQDKIDKRAKELAND
ncbi:MAG: hypothetical protein B7Y17_05870 [Sulfuricurvum sp. 24-42-5]|nr:MAG: hypothetical protein B7Y17_05870 [Sulfuricurvum sp. 24-42-5]